MRYAKKVLPYIYRSFVNAVKENRMYMSPFALNEVLVFVRKGKEIPFGEAAKNVDEVNFNEIQTILK